MAEHNTDDGRADHSERQHEKHRIRHESHEEQSRMSHLKEHHAETSAPQHGAPKGRSEIKITIPKGLNLTTITTFVAIALLVIVIFQAGETYTLSKKLGTMKAKAIEESKAPVIQITAIEADCKECTPITNLLSTIKSAKLNITKSLTLLSTDAHSQQLITEYSIKKLPTIIVTGEIGKVQLADAGFTKVNDALVYTNVAPPYLDLASSQVKGLVSVTLVNVSSCKICSDLMPVVQQLGKIVTVSNFKLVDSSSAEGQALVQQYSMARLPGLLLSSDIKEYTTAAQIAKAGTAKQDGVIALGANAPYINTSTGKVAGATQMILLNDSTCATCYDLNIHLAILRNNYHVFMDPIRTVDVNSPEGQALVAKYNIKAAPTFLLSGDVAPYDALRNVWPTVGTVESDGTYVFRTMSAIAGRPYKDLTTGNVVQNAVQQKQAKQ